MYAWQRKFSMKPKDYVELYRLARKRLNSEEDYWEFQRFQAALILEYLAKFQVVVKDWVVLDLGSGVGGYSSLMREREAMVISLDLVMPTRHSLASRGFQVVGDALRIPILDSSLDFVFCASLIEHVSNPRLLLQEIERVLKPGGYCYLSFPPYYSIRGGHEFSPFHLLGEQVALRISKLLRRATPEWSARIYAPEISPTSFKHLYRNWGLHKLTISEARKLVSSSKFSVIDCSTRYIPINTTKWGLIGEFLTWHAQFLLRKREQTDDS